MTNTPVVVVLDRAAFRDELVSVLQTVGRRDDWVAVKKCGVPVRTVRAAARRGVLRIRRIGRADFVNRAELDAWIAKQGERRAKTDRAGDGDDLACLLAAPDLEVGGGHAHRG